MATGRGSSLGAALINAIAQYADGVVGVRRSFTAKGWHAQISKLTSSPRGYEAAAKAGLSVNKRTLMDWLAERREPSKANQERIAKAYAIMAGRWPAEVEYKEIRITGEVSIGDDTRDRGSAGHAPLVIDGSAGAPFAWSDMRSAWNRGEVHPDEFEEWFMGVIEADLGEWSIPPEFGGSAYTVEIV